MISALLISVLFALQGFCFPFDMFQRLALPQLGKTIIADVLPRQDAAVDPPARDSPSTRETFTCTDVSSFHFLSAGRVLIASKGPGPDRLDCPDAIAVWSTLADEHGHINIEADRCRTVTKKCCTTIVCAPKEAISILPEEVTGRMWLPLTMKCVSGGRGGSWQDGQGNLQVKMERPTSGQCSA